MLVISIAALSLAFVPLAIPNESMPLLTRYYVGIILSSFGLSIRMIDVIEKSWRRHAKQKMRRAMAMTILARTSIVNLLFAFPAMVWALVYVQTVRPEIGSFAFVYCIIPIVLVLGVGLWEYKLLYA
jgi:hypothetical protein